MVVMAEFTHERNDGVGSCCDGLVVAHRILSCVHPFLAASGLLIVEVSNSWPALEEA